MNRIAVIALLAILASGTAALAEEDLSGRWGVGAYFGNHKLLGGNHDYSNVDQFGALHLRYGLSRRWVLDGALKYGNVRAAVSFRLSLIPSGFSSVMSFGGGTSKLRLQIFS